MVFTTIQMEYLTAAPWQLIDVLLKAKLSKERLPTLKGGFAIGVLS
jgi:hypothetical protein